MENIGGLEGDLPCIFVNEENWIDDRSVRCQAGNPPGQTNTSILLWDEGEQNPLAI